VTTLSREGIVETDLARIQKHSFVRHVERHDSLSSTNDRGIEIAADAELCTPALIVARQQTAGRGRGANRWWSQDGALTFSLVFDPQCDIPGHPSAPLASSHWPCIALSAGVALCDVLEQTFPALGRGLKWPNDVLVEGKKVAGILVEVPPAKPPASRRLVLGMGLNVNNSLVAAPPEIQAAGISLIDATSAPVDAAQLLLSWLNRFADLLRALADDDPKLPTRWQSLCVLTGRSIELETGQRTIRGLCRGIDHSGALLVESVTGIERIYAASLVRAV